MSFFKSLFGKKNSIQDLAVLGVDMHSHLIPSIDDGVKTVDEAIKIIKRFSQLGYKKIITTPHIMAGGYDNTPEIILKGRDEVREAIENEEIDIKFEAAAEYYLDERFLKYIEEKSLLTFGDNQVLFELSFLNKPNNLDQAIFDMQTQGYQPILAHPERYPFFYEKDLSTYKDIRAKGVALQINLFSLVGGYGKGAQKIAEKMIDEDMIDYVGSDIHRPQQFVFLEKCLKNEYVEKLLNSERIKNKYL
ncbi:MAG: tyrosine-protein phosphatase [Chitinophagales bacterium]